MAHKLPGTNIPLIGHQIARVGRVLQITAHPCDVDPLIAVEAFFYSAPIMIGTLFKPAYLNDQEEHFQSREIGRKGRHGRRRINVEEEFPGVGPGAKRVGWWLFKISSLAQRIGWYFAVLDAGTQLAVNWTSLAYTWSGCPDVTAGNGKSLLNVNTGAPTWAGKYVDLWSNIYAKFPVWGNTAYLGTLEDGPATFMGSVQLADPIIPTPRAQNVTMRFVNVLSGEGSPPHTLHYTDPPGTAATHVHRDLGFLANRQQWALEILAADGYFGLTGDMRLYQSKLDGVGPDP